MKPISEYNFREIVGQFVIIYDETDLISSKYNSFVAYCYIDIDAGMSFKIYGGLKNDEIFDINKIITIRYSDELIIETYDILTDDMESFALAIDRVYTPNWIINLRDDTDFDSYRDTQFPDDIIIPVLTDYNDPSKGEYLWVRPVELQNNRIIVKTIEDGKIIPKGLQALLIKEINENNEVIIFAATASWLEKYNDEIEKQNQGGTNEK